MSETRPNLKKYTKDELIWLVEHICYTADPFGLEDALASLERRRTQDMIRKSDEHAKKAHDLREKAFNLMGKHAGMKISEIDPHELEMISKYLKEARKEDEAYMRMIKEASK